MFGSINSAKVYQQEELYNRASLVTVKVLLEGSGRGSGILIQRQGSVYTVLTNDHVARGEGQYKIQLHNNQEYDAQKLELGNFDGNDLALLQFESSENYEIASLKSLSNLQENDPVFVAGYPGDLALSDSGEFSFIPGQITFLGLNQPLRGGYQVGTSNQIKKGMSGGPLLNLQGEVVGINGRHISLWGDRNNCSYEYKDGSLACEDLPEVYPLSWTIPIETFVKQAPCSLDISLINSNVDDDFYWYAGINEGSAAAQLLNPAPQSLAQWNLVVCHWKKAIKHLETVPLSSSFHEKSQRKIQEYQNNLDYAQIQLENAQ